MQLIKLFHSRRKNSSSQAAVATFTQPPEDGLHKISSASELLEPYKNRIKIIKREIGVTDAHWDALYQPVLSSFAEIAQLFPASENHHHPDLGGLLKHGIEVVENVVKLKRGQMYPPGASAEDMVAKGDVWTYGIVTASLLHDIAKPLTDINVELFDKNKNRLSYWNPWTHSLSHTEAVFYKFVHNSERKYKMHEMAGPLFARQLIPDVGMKWLSDEPALLQEWLASISKQAEFGHNIINIIIEADRMSVSMDLSGSYNPSNSTRANKALSARMLTAMRFLFKNHPEKVTHNKPGAAVFVPSNDPYLYLVSKRVLDAIRMQMLAEGQGGVPADNPRLMSELQDRSILESTDAGKAIFWKSVHIKQEGEETWSHKKMSLLKIEKRLVWPLDSSEPEWFNMENVFILEENAELNPIPSDSSQPLTPVTNVIPLVQDLVIANDIITIKQEPIVDIPDVSVSPVVDAIENDESLQNALHATLEDLGLIENTNKEEIELVVHEDRASEIDTQVLDDNVDEYFDEDIDPYAGTEHELPEEIEPVKKKTEPDNKILNMEVVIQEKLEVAPDNPGLRFANWLIQHIRSGDAVFNTSNATLHTTEVGLLLVSPAIFKKYEPILWQKSQKKFEKLKLNERTASGANIWTFIVEGKRKKSTIKGYLIVDAGSKLNLHLPPPNPVLSLDRVNTK